MSRGDFGSGNDGYGAIGGSTTIGYRSAAYQGGGESDLFELVSSRTQTISSNVAALDKLVRQIGTVHDGEHLRVRLTELEHTTQKVASEAAQAIKQLSGMVGGAGRKQERLQLERLKNEFKQALTRFQKSQQTIREEVSMTQLPSRKAAETSTFHDEDDEHERLLRAAEEEERRQGLLAQQQEIEYEAEEFQERADRMEQLERDILEINDIFRDLAMLVHEQGTLVDNIEDNIDHAGANVEEGNRQLVKAAQYQKKARKKMCCLLIILLVVAGVIGLIVYLSVRH